MFYLLHKKKLLAIDPDRIYAFCPRCGVLHAVDLQAEIADGDCDLLGTLTYCGECGKAIRAAALAATEGAANLRLPTAEGERYGKEVHFDR